MHRLFIFIFPWLLAASALAKTNAPAPEGNRFLFVVDTSLAMSRLEHGGRQTVFDLVYSGIFKQMRAGDTFGIWTFNDDVSAGVYPMQSWDPAQNLELASHAGLFLKGQRYQHKARLDRAVEKILALVKTVKNVNVLLVTEGDGSLAKTGLDKKLIAAYAQTVEESRTAKTPVITTLVAQRGEIVSWSVTLAGNPIKLPHAVAPNEVIPMLASARVGPPIVAAPTLAPSNASPAVAVAPVAPVAPPAPPRVIVIKQTPPKEPAPAIVAKPAPVENPTPTAIVSTPPPVVAPAPSVTPAIAKSEPVVAKSETEKMEPEPAPAPTPVAPTMTAKPTPLPKIIPASVTVAAREIPAVAPETISNAAPRALAPVLAVVPEPATNPLHLLMVGGGLLIVGLGLVLFLVLRARSTYQPTFISRSINQR